MKILHVLASDRFSGAENVVCQIISMFRDDSNIEMVYCSPDGQIRDALNERGVSFAPVCAFTAKELRRVLREQKPDIIHAHDMRASFLSALLCGRTPLVSHIHGNFASLNKISAKSLAYLFVVAKAKRIFWVSQNERQSKGFGKSKNKVLKNVFLKNERYNSQNCIDEEIDVLFVGRFVKEKDPVRFLRVIQLIKKENPKVKAAMLERQGEGLYCSTGLSGIQGNGTFFPFEKNETNCQE